MIKIYNIIAIFAFIYISAITNSEKIFAEPFVDESIKIEDKIESKQVNRAELIDKYLDKHKSPVMGKGEFIVQTADKYNLDYKLLVAISGIESTFCKRIPYQSYNCWGWGIYGNNMIKFNSFEEGFEKVAQGLSEHYVSKGLDTPEKIGRKYNPPNPVKWAAAVNKFASDIEKN